MRFIKSLSAKDYLSYYVYIKTRVMAEYFLFTLPNLLELKKTVNLKSTKKGKNAFVFANGPSLEKLDPYKVKRLQEEGYEVFAGNSFINTGFSQIVKPDWYILSDPAHFQKYETETTAITKDRTKKDVEKLNTLQVQVFVPHRYARHAKSIIKNYYIFNDSFDVFSKNVTNPSKKRGHVPLTLYKALGIACFMGYDSIYICGFDNDWFKTLSVDKNNQMFWDNKHFYSREIDEVTKQKLTTFQDVPIFLLEMHQVFSGLKKFVGATSIFNLDENSLVDCFSKYHYLDIYKCE